LLKKKRKLTAPFSFPTIYITFSIKNDFGIYNRTLSHGSEQKRRDEQNHAKYTEKRKTACGLVSTKAKIFICCFCENEGVDEDDKQNLNGSKLIVTWSESIRSDGFTIFVNEEVIWYHVLLFIVRFLTFSVDWPLTANVKRRLPKRANIWGGHNFFVCVLLFWPQGHDITSRWYFRSKKRFTRLLLTSEQFLRLLEGSFSSFCRSLSNSCSWWWRILAWKLSPLKLFFL